MQVYGLYLVRNEVDVIEVNLRHHFATAIHHAIVVDNGSTDGTLQLLLELAGELPILVISEPGEYRQADLTNRMAQMAVERSADWVLPIDADEFWIAHDGTILALLEQCPLDVGVLRCEVTNFVQQRQEFVASPKALSGLTMRVAECRGSVESAQQLVEEGDIAFVEMHYPPKCVARATLGMRIHTGNHDVDGVAGGREWTSEIVCLHAPLRARSSLTGKLDQGRRVEELNHPPGLYWHVRRWWSMARRAGSLDTEWAANSHESGTLDFGDTKKQLVEDTRLQSVVEPWITGARHTEASSANRLDPVLGAYLLALPTVPGWFSELDFRILVALDQAQKRADVSGDILEIGAYHGKSAILLGYLTQGRESLHVCDLFNLNADVSDMNREENERWYMGFGQADFERQFRRFHESLPDLIVGPSTDIDREALASTCRLVHIDGSHVHAIVKEDIAAARRVLRQGGIVALDDISTPHNPGSAIAAWEGVLGGVLHPLCLTDAKLYATCDALFPRWLAEIQDWAAGEPDIRVEMHTIAGHGVARLVHEPRPLTAVDAAALSTLPPLASHLDGPAETGSSAPVSDFSAPVESQTLPPVGLRALLRELPGAFERAIRFRWDRARARL
jgi:hypothetical protein